MLKKNAPEVYAKVKKYMLENIDFSGRGISEKLQQMRPFAMVRQIFHEEKSWEIRTYSERAAFESWIRGLASVFEIYPVYCKTAADYVADWLEMSADEREAMSDDHGDRLFIEICWLAFFNACIEEANI